MDNNSNNNNTLDNEAINQEATNEGRLVVCPICKREQNKYNRFCEFCGNSLVGATETKDVVLENDVDVATLPKASDGTMLDKEQYNEYMTPNLNSVLAKMVIKELNSKGMLFGKTIPQLEKRKFLIAIVYIILLVILTLVYVAYHFSIMKLLMIFVTIIYVLIIRKYSLSQYIIKQIKLRPDEKISYIVESIASTATSSKLLYCTIRVFFITLAVFSLLTVFGKPHLIYERQSTGYAVRYYTYGLLNQEENLVIPKTYRGKEVISIRGDVFKNVTFLKKVVLPDTIYEIRGGAFQNCHSLESINLPKNIKEIHGSTFESCYSLKSIIIPEGVTRIGGSAFRDCYNLEEATIPESVTEIGSSAFRNTFLTSVCVSEKALINERAFKDTNTEIRYYEYSCLPMQSYNYYDSSSSQYNSSNTNEFYYDDNDSSSTNNSIKNQEQGDITNNGYSN